MRSCGQQAATVIHRTAFCPLPAVVSVGTTSSSQQHSAAAVASIRLPRSPPTTPRSPVDLSDPELVRQLRAFLLRAAARPAGISIELEELLLSKLAVDQQELSQLLSSSSLADACSSSNNSSGSLEPQQMQELQDGLEHMLQLFSPAELFHLLQQQPALLFTPLASWCQFFAAYGFSSSQVKNLISQTQGEVMTKGTLVTAGDAIMHLKGLGFDNDEIRHRVVAYCPQVLAMSTQDIDLLIRLWGKFSVGVDDNGSSSC